jgi:hypothetical protein
MKPPSPTRFRAFATTAILLVAAATPAPAASVVVGEWLAGWTAEPGSEFAPSHFVPGLAASHLRVDSSQAVLEPGTVVPGSVFLNVDQANSLAAAVLNEQYFELELAPDAGLRMRLASFSLEAARGGNSTPRGWGLFSSFDGFTASLGGGQIPSIQPDFTAFPVDLSDLPEFDTAVILRIYAYGPLVPGTGVFFDNIAVFGTLVPEPSTAMMAAAGLLLTLRRRRHGS